MQRRVANTRHTELDFRETQTDIPILRLKVNWTDNTTHVLVVVYNRAGQHDHVVILANCWAARLNCSSRQNTYDVQVYGLKQETITGLDNGQNNATSVYSVVAVTDKITLLPVLSEGMQVREVTLKKTRGKRLILANIESQDNFEVTVSHEAPLAYSLKHRLPQGSTASLHIIYNERLKKEYLMMSSAPFHDSIPLLPIRHSRTIYQVRVVALENTQNCTSGHPNVCYQYLPCGKSKLITIKTHMVKKHLQKLLDKAESYCYNRSRHRGSYRITQFYRNKQWCYYEDILENKGGLMEKYIKDNNGDPYSPINNEINGLFFSASLETRTMLPPPFSYFGDTRLFVPAEELFTSDTKMYFTDFFCHNKTHYVTIVLTKNGSFEDRFCQPHILELDPRNNPFFTVREQRCYQYPRASQDPRFHQYRRSHQAPFFVNQKIFTMVAVTNFHVEFLYTENVDIDGLIKKCGNDKVYFRSVQGRGVSRKDGIPKISDCALCNLDPPPRSSFGFPPNNPRTANPGSFLPPI